MGQSNSSIISKLGYSMYWTSMWDDKLNYTKKLKEDIFLNMFLPLFFKKIFLISNETKLSAKEILKKKTKQNFISFFLFFGKIWILRYHNWIVVVFYIYNPRKNSNKQLFKNKIKNKNIFIFMKTYFISKLKKNSILKTYELY